LLERVLRREEKHEERNKRRWLRELVLMDIRGEIFEFARLVNGM
jgi:hypothetical protein